MLTSIICTAANFSNTGPGRQSWGERLQLVAQGHVQTVGEEGQEDVGFDALIVLVEDRLRISLSVQHDQNHDWMPFPGRAISPRPLPC
jgi:hypothetical protein